jgi:glycerophosphoryl diester phosphodiesterase
MKIKAIALRGNPQHFPENTRSSFQSAIDMHFSHTLLEVHLTKDGIPVVMRDATIDRMTSGRGEIRMFTYEELLQFTINHDERIPTLEEVLHLTNGRIKTAIDIKQYGLYPGLEEKVYEVIQQLDCMDNLFILSQNQHTLARLRMLSRDIALGLHTSVPHPEDLPFLQEIRATYYSITYQKEYINQLDLAELKRLNIQPIIGPVNTIKEMKVMQQYPDVLVATTELEKFQAMYYPETITDWQKVGI